MINYKLGLYSHY